MSYRTEQEDFWAGQFGTDYIARNESEPLFFSKTAMWSTMLRAAHGVMSARELGCNIGLNLMALKKLQPQMQLSGWEINPEAARRAREADIGEVHEGSILEPIEAPRVDLTFTVTVLIHIAPEHLSKVYENLVTGSNRYVLVAEYYNPAPTQIVYRGHENRLFKRDFAGDLMDQYGLKLVDYGFVYKRDNWAPQDDITWFLLEK